MKVLILSRSDYNFNDEKTGEIVNGSNIYYLIPGGGEPLKLSVNQFNDNLQLLNDIKSFPAYYDLEFKTVARKNQILMVPVSAKFLKEIELF